MNKEKVQEFVEFVSEKVEHVGLREGLIGQARAKNLPFAWEMLARYIAADEDSKRDIEAFHSPMVDSEVTGAQHMLDLKAADVKPSGCRICGTPYVRQGDSNIYKSTCDCRSKLPTTDDEVKAYANAGFCDFATVLGEDDDEDPTPVCDIVPLADGGVAWLRDDEIARFRSALDEAVARRWLELAKRIVP